MCGDGIQPVMDEEEETIERVAIFTYLGRPLD